MRLLFNDKPEDDLINILAFINDFTEAAGLKKVEVEPRIIESLLRGMHLDFPCVDGLENASAFKKAATFILYFVSERPITKPFPAAAIGDELSKIDNHQNAILALNIALKALEGAVIQGRDGDVVLTHPIEVSQHSYIDIVEALAKSTPAAGFQLTTVLLEQLAYKSNPDCQYLPLFSV